MYNNTWDKQPKYKVEQNKSQKKTKSDYISYNQLKRTDKTSLFF